jgi:hypothetical protein
MREMRTQDSVKNYMSSKVKQYTGERLDAMKGCKAWAKRAHACDYEKQHDNPS